jgi:hypothetical protein
MQTMFSFEKLLGWIAYNLAALGLIFALIIAAVALGGYEIAWQPPRLYPLAETQ